MQTLSANLPSPPSATPPAPAEVFTALYDGLYQVAIVQPEDVEPWYYSAPPFNAPNWATVELFLNGDSVGLGSTTQRPAAGYLPQVTCNLYLAAGDVLSYRGPAAKLALARLGDEATD